MLRLFVFGFLAVFASAGVINDGKCPDLKPIENFDVKQYSGVWYEIEKLPVPYETKSNCASAEYTPDGELVKVKNAYVENGVQIYVEGTAKFAEDANKAAKLVVSLKLGETVKDAPLLVVATDYKNYAIAYNCKYDEKTKNHQTNAWVLSRSKKLEGDAKTAVDNFLKANSAEIDSTKFIVNDFSDEACKFTSSKYQEFKFPTKQ